MLKKLHIPFDSFENRGVHTETFDDIEKSFFKDIYLQAYSAVYSIHMANNLYKSSERSNQQIHDIQNVIAFTGRRGTGKTSAMLTFANALKKSSKKFPKGKEDLQNCEFYDLPYIDASLLDENEDLLIVVISKMLFKLNEIESNMKKSGIFEDNKGVFSDLSKKINNIYNRYNELKSNKQYSEASSYEALMKNAEKYNIRESLRELVDKFINVYSMASEKNPTCSYYAEKNSRYLVICIDDIDMVRSNAMEVMNCIYTYFMLPKIIVLTTLNFQLLSKSIEKYYYKTLAYNDKDSEHFSLLCKEQTNDYLRKIVSSDMRIVMPSWKKNDYREFIEMKVNLIEKGQRLIEITKKFPSIKNGHIISFLNGKEITNNTEAPESVSISPKHLILLMLADRTGIYLDAVGFKRHFMEPNSLRNMMDLFYLFYNMENPRIRDENEKYFKYTEKNIPIFQQNIKVTMDYFYFKLLPDLCMSNEEEDAFHKFYTEVLTRRAKRIIIYYHQKIEKESKEDLREKKHFEEESKLPKDYSYGELFRVIHHSSRLNIMDKNMIKAILACYSFILPRIYDEYIVEYLEQRNTYISNNNMIIEEFEKLQPSRKSEILENFKFDDKLKKQEVLYTVVGDTLLGNWRNDLFQNKQLMIDIESNYLPFGKNKCECEWEHLVYLLMLYPINYNDDLKELEISQIRLAPTAFVINVSRYKEFFERIRKIGGICNQECFKNACDAVENKISEYVLKQRYPHFALPIHQTDLIYNVIKRSVGAIIYSNDFLVEKREVQGDPEEIIKNLFENIEKELIREDNEYSQSSRSITFKNQFRTCPVVNHFLNEKKITYSIKIKAVTETKKDSEKHEKEQSKLSVDFIAKTNDKELVINGNLNFMDDNNKE